MANSKAFHHKYTIGFRDTDAAGVLFSGNLVTICHVGYEAMMESLNLSLGSILKLQEFDLPVVHLEGDFQKALTVSDEIDIAVSVAEIGNTSFQIQYEWRNKDGELCATAATVHVCIEAGGVKPKALPARLRAALERYLVS
jgi:YbgC/YbaW family acyl-CoA thioester hydrolase